MKLLERKDIPGICELVAQVFGGVYVVIAAADELWIDLPFIFFLGYSIIIAIESGEPSPFGNPNSNDDIPESIAFIGAASTCMAYAAPSLCCLRGIATAIVILLACIAFCLFIFAIFKYCLAKSWDS